MSKATIEQLEELAEYGLFTGRDIDADKAASQIEEAKASGKIPDPCLVDEFQLKILQLVKRRLTKDLETAKGKKNIKELEYSLHQITWDIKELKKDAREEKKEYYEDRAKFEARRIHGEITNYKSYRKLTKKPTIAEIKAVMEAIIEQKPDWNSFKDKKLENLIVDTLRRNFKHLRTNKPRPSSKKKQSGTSCGGIIFLLFILAVIVFFVIKEAL